MYDTVKKKERYYTMAEARPTEERIAELDKKIEQIKAQKKQSYNVRNRQNAKLELKDLYR